MVVFAAIEFFAERSDDAPRDDRPAPKPDPASDLLGSKRRAKKKTDWEENL